MLVNCAAYKQGRKLADIELRDAKRYMNEPGCFVWVALRDPEPAEMKELQEEFALHDLAVEDASGGHQRPKMEEYGRSLFIVVHSVEPGDGGLHIGQVSIFVGDSYILSVRHATRYGFSELRGRTEREPELLSHGPAYVLYALLDSVVDRYFPVLEALSDETEELEEKIFGAQTTRAQVEALYALKRKLTGLKHAVSPLLEVTTKLHGGRVPAMCAGLQDYFVLKLNSTGGIMWQKAYGGSDNEVIRYIKQVSDGGYLGAGFTHSFGTKGDIMLIKLDANGNLEWDLRYGGAKFEEPSSILELSDGYIVMEQTGSFSGNTDGWVFKIDNDGQLAWQKRIGGGSFDELSAALPTPDGGFNQVVFNTLKLEGRVTLTLQIEKNRDKVKDALKAAGAAEVTEREGTWECLFKTPEDTIGLIKGICAKCGLEYRIFEILKDITWRGR